MRQRTRSAAQRELLRATRHRAFERMQGVEYLLESSSEVTRYVAPSGDIATWSAVLRDWDELSSTPSVTARCRLWWEPKGSNTLTSREAAMWTSELRGCDVERQSREIWDGATRHRASARWSRKALNTCNSPKGRTWRRSLK